jgi:hypothetical protein
MNRSKFSREGKTPYSCTSWCHGHHHFPPDAEDSPIVPPELAAALRSVGGAAGGFGVFRAFSVHHSPLALSSSSILERILFTAGHARTHSSRFSQEHSEHTG